MKLFRRPCVSEKQVLDSSKDRKFKMQSEDTYLKKIQATAKEYEYVRQEHGYDYVPTSQYVPSHSLDESSDD